MGVAVGDSTILRRLFDQEIVILLSYCEQGSEVSRLITTTMTTAQSPCSLHMERGISNTTSRMFLYEYHRNMGFMDGVQRRYVYCVDFLMRLVEQEGLI